METNPKEPHSSKLQVRKQTTIADLPEICMDTILSSFHIKDLIEAAKTNLALRHSAIRVFRLKFGKKKFQIKYGNETDMARMIIHFGPYISNITLRIHFRSVANLEKKLLQIILEECSPTLKELTIMDTYGLPLRLPFPNLQTMDFRLKVGCDIHPTWFQIKQWFPNIRKITVSDHDGRRNFDKYLVNHMPNLRELCLLSGPSYRIPFPMVQLINTNRHIESLRIAMDSRHIVTYTDGDVEKFQSAISWENLNVSKLDIRQEGMDPIIHLENVSKLKNLRTLAISADVYPNIDRFAFPLEGLVIETGGQNATTINFIVNHRFLKRLSIKVDGGLALCHSKRIAEHLNDLTEISFDLLNFGHPNAPDFTNGLCEIVHHCKALKAITVTYTPSKEIPKDDDKSKQIRQYYADLEGKIDKMSTPNRWKLCYECKALDIEFNHHNPVRFLADLEASKHAYIFKFVNKF